MKKENKKSLFTQILTYAVVLAIFVYILYSIITSTLAGRIGTLYNDQRAKDLKLFESTEQAKKDQAVQNLVQLSSAVPGNEKDLTGYYVTTQPITGYKISVDGINIDFYAYGVGSPSEITNVKGFVGYVKTNGAKTDITDTLTFVQVSLLGNKNLQLVPLTVYDKDKKIVKSADPILFTVPLSAKDKDEFTNNLKSLEIEVFQQKVAPATNTQTGAQIVLYDANSNNTPTGTNYVADLNTKLQNKYTAASTTFTAAKLSDYNSKLAINIVIVILVFAVIVYIFFIHKHVKAYLANKKQKKNAQVEAEDESNVDENVEEATVEEVQSSNEENK